MFEINLNYRDQLVIVDEAKKQNRSILVKKALGSGRLDPIQSMQWFSKLKGISSIILGSTSSKNQVKCNCF